MMEEASSHNASVCQLLQQSVLDICKDHYKAVTDVEVDAIICLSAINSSQQNIVKIHQFLPREDFKSSSPDCFADMVPDIRRENGFGIARGLQMQIKKRKRLMCRQKHNFRVKMDLSKTDLVSSHMTKEDSESTSVTSRKKLHKNSLSQFHSRDKGITDTADKNCGEVDDIENTLLVTRDRQGHLLRVSQLSQDADDQGSSLMDCVSNNSEFSDMNGRKLSEYKSSLLAGACNSSKNSSFSKGCVLNGTNNEDQISIKCEPTDDGFEDSDGYGEVNSNNMAAEKYDSDLDVSSLGEQCTASSTEGQVMIFNKALGSVMTGPLTAIVDEAEDESSTQDSKQTSYGCDLNRDSSEEMVFKTEPNDPDYDSVQSEKSPINIESVRGNATFHDSKSTKQVSLLRNCLVRSKDNQCSDTSPSGTPSNLQTSFLTENAYNLDSLYTNRSVNDFSEPGNGFKGTSKFSYCHSTQEEEKFLSAGSDEDRNLSYTTGNSCLLREPAVLRRTKKKASMQKLVSLLNKSQNKTTSFELGSRQSQLSPLTSKSNSSRSFNHKTFDDSMSYGKELKQFSCERCGTGFSSRKSKMRHERFTCGNHTFECSLCGKFYSRADSKQRHMLKMHGVKMTPFQVGQEPQDTSIMEVHGRDIDDKLCNMDNL